MRQACTTAALGAWLVWAATTGTAVAAVEPGHWYGGVSGGLSTTDIAVGDWNDGSLTSGSVDTSGFSYTAFAGYDFNRFLGLEVTYWRMADTQYFPTITSQVTIANNQLTIVNDSGASPIYGIGAELRFYRDWWLRAGWTRSTVGLARSKHYTVDYPSLGLMIHF